jgi:hypothetical protein
MFLTVLKTPAEARRCLVATIEGRIDGPRQLEIDFNAIYVCRSSALHESA